MKKNILRNGFWILGVVLAGCATTSASSDYDRAADFSKIQTYAWEDQPNISGDPRFNAPDLRDSIKQSVETELGAKGVQKAVTGQPDVLLKYYITVEQKKESVGGGCYPPAFPTRGAWSGATGPSSYAAQEMKTFHYEDGTFVLDMLKPGTGAILWRGTLEGMVDPTATPEKRVSRVPAAVAKVLKNFPPGKK